MILDIFRGCSASDSPKQPPSSTGKCSARAGPPQWCGVLHQNCCVALQLDNLDPAMAQAVTVSYKAFLDANMWMGFGYSMDGATEVNSNSNYKNTRL